MKQWKLFILITAGITVCVLAFLCVYLDLYSEENKIKLNKKTVIFNVTKFNGNLHENLETKNTASSDINPGYEFVPIPKSSSATRDVPWINEKLFLDACTSNGTPVFMAAYRTVLRDPLPGEEDNVHLAAQMLCGIVIKPGGIFSQNASIGPYTQARGFQKGPTYIGNSLTTTIGGGVCKIASTLYNVAILCNLQIVERHCHSMPVPYVPYGQDATVAYGVRDLKFRNSNVFPVMIWAKGVDNVLYIGFYGSEKPPAVKWHHEKYNIVKAGRIYRKNPDLPPGTENIVLEGMEGATVKTWITITNQDGTATVKSLGISKYNPMDYIIETEMGCRP